MYIIQYLACSFELDYRFCTFYLAIYYTLHVSPRLYILAGHRLSSKLHLSRDCRFNLYQRLYLALGQRQYSTIGLRKYIYYLYLAQNRALAWPNIAHLYLIWDCTFIWPGTLHVSNRVYIVFRYIYLEIILVHFIWPNFSLHVSQKSCSST
jgi:hypothetical protein